jgi:hypothetical protein
MLRWVALVVLMTLIARGRSRGGSVLAAAAGPAAAAAAGAVVNLLLALFPPHLPC